MAEGRKLPVKGYTFGYGGRMGDYEKQETFESLDELCKVGVNYIALAFNVFVDNVRSTEIRYRYTLDATDAEIIGLISAMHERGVRVCLKPMIDSLDHEWRARIDFGPDKGAWAKWFYEYEAYIVHFAKIAQMTGCEMFCIGCELCGTEAQEEHWRQLIKAVRAVYDGHVTYNTNHGHELFAKWYDAIDSIGTSGYFPVADHPGADVNEMMEGWEKAKPGLLEASRKWNKQILFMEIGCRSALGTAMMPWDYMHPELPLSQEEQANFYEAAYRSLAGCEWFMGFFWWDWSIKLTPADRIATDRGFSIYGKKAQKVLMELYKDNE